MKKVFLFENEGGQLHKCLFAGLDDNGHPQWMMVDQGKEIMMLEEYLKVNLMKIITMQFIRRPASLLR